VIGGCPSGVARNSDGNCPIGSGCPGGVARNSDGNCPTPTTSCSFPAFLVNGTCCTREAYTAGLCGGRPTTTTTTTGCPGGAQRIDGQCPGTTTTTTGGCKSGQFRGDNGKCQDRPSTKNTTTTCGEGMHAVGARCAVDKKNTKSKDTDNKKTSDSGIKNRKINTSQPTLNRSNNIGNFNSPMQGGNRSSGFPNRRR
jgi:hypothetical protein